MEMQKFLNPGPGYKLQQFVKPGTGPIELLTNYKGLHLSQEVQIRSTSPNSVNIYLPHHPEWVLASKIVTLDHSNFTTPLTAHVAEVDWRTSTASLCSLAEADHKWQHRTTDRVQPGDPLRIQINAGRKKATVCLSNISQSGLGLIVNHLAIHQLNLEPGTIINLEFFLPNQPTSPLALRGIISRSNSIKSLMIYNIGIAIHPNQKQADLIKRYIDARIKSILSELKKSFTFGFEPIGTKDLFF